MKRSSKKHTVTLTSTSVEPFPTSSLAPSSSILLDGKDKILNEIKSKSPSLDMNDSLKKSYAILNNFSEGMKTYPKYISYESSTLLSVAFAIDNEIELKKLPKEDQAVINQQLDDLKNPDIIRDKFKIKLDDSKDFELHFKLKKSDDVSVTEVDIDELLNELEGNKPVEVESVKIRLFNTIIHPQPIEVGSGVPIKIDGELANVNEPSGVKIQEGCLNIEKQVERFKHLANIPTTESKVPEPIIPRQELISVKSPNKNAFEIRSDVLSMAIKWASLEEGGNLYVKPSDEKLLSLARKFYDFVENKRY